MNFNKHRLILSVNGFTPDTNSILLKYKSIISEVIYNDTNIGTAEAINKAWSRRLPGEHAIKMDDDVVIYHRDWVEELEEAIIREPRIGQCGLKRKDLAESPSRSDFFKTELIMLPHTPGQRWIVAEKVNHVMGTCQLYSSLLLDKIGYLCQPTVYGFDDSLASLRSQLAGFINVFLPHIEIDHIDEGTTNYQTWKERQASKDSAAYNNLVIQYKTGKRPIYYNPFNK